MSKNLGVLKKETVCNSGGNSMDTRTCVLKWRGSTYGSDRSVPDVSDADLSHRAAEPQVTTLCNWSHFCGSPYPACRNHTPLLSQTSKKKRVYGSNCPLSFPVFTDLLSQYLKYKHYMVWSQYILHWCVELMCSLPSYPANQNVILSEISPWIHSYI